MSKMQNVFLKDIGDRVKRADQIVLFPSKLQQIAERREEEKF